MSSKRVFSHNTDINFNDYLKNKNGIEIIKNIKTKKNHQISFFVSYAQFITLTKTYFKYYKQNCLGISKLKNIYDSNTSFIFYQNMLSHLRDCHLCKNCTDIDQLYECEDLHNVLYPYANYIDTNISNEIYLHNRFILDDSCKEKQCYYNADLIKLFHKDDIHSESSTLDPRCRTCSQQRVKKEDCSACYKKPDKSMEIQETQNFHAFPSQNTFVFETLTETNDHEKRLRINAYSKYPNILSCDMKKQELIDKNKKCNNRRPLFV